MKRLFLLFGGAAVLLVFSGCGMPPGERAVREILAAYQDLRDALRSVQDANSATAAVDGLDAKYARLIASLKDFDKQKSGKMRQTTLEELGRQINQVQTQLKDECERLERLRGLPVAFWKIVRLRNLEHAITKQEMLDPAERPGTDDILRSMRDTRNLLATNGADRVIHVEMQNLPPELAQKACDRIQQAAPGATVLRFTFQTITDVDAGPTDNYQAVLAKLDLGTVTFEDEPQRIIKITVDRRKLGARANSDAEEMQLRIKDQEEESEKFRKRMDEAQQETARQIAEDRKKDRGPDPSEPDYFEQLAERMITGDVFQREKAIDKLLNAAPSDVSSAETRKKIARNFKKIAEGDDHFNKKKAVQGLVVWGGKFAVPILVKMLDEARGFDEEEILKALGDLKDPQAAEALTARLGNFSTHRESYSALKQMGGSAEDALIAVAPSDNSDVCLAAINLLGDCGTEKSLPTLREASASQNVDVRNAAKAAIRKITARKNKAKADGS
jgi:hypothetical protein